MSCTHLQRLDARARLANQLPRGPAVRQWDGGHLRKTRFIEEKKEAQGRRGLLHQNILLRQNNPSTGKTGCWD